MKNTMTVKNKAFWAKSKSEQRVAIAKDVVRQLSLKTIKATTGKYFRLSKTVTIDNSGWGFDQVLRDIKTKGAKCEVCGIGSCFVSLVNLGDRVKTPDSFTGDRWEEISSWEMMPHLKRIFTKLQLQLIESAFETSSLFCSDREMALKSVAFGRKYRNVESRLIAIMKNIIKNKGMFIP